MQLRERHLGIGRIYGKTMLGIKGTVPQDFIVRQC